MTEPMTVQQNKQNSGQPAKIGRLGDLFLEKGLLTLEQIERIAQQQKQKKLRFGDAALELGLLSQAQIDWALGEQFGYSSRELLNGVADASLSFLHQPFSREAEEIRRLRSEILLKLSHQQSLKVAVVSPASGEGKSYMAASLAIAFSQVGKRTLLIDGDLRSGDLHQLFGLGTADGLSSVLAGRASLTQVVLPLMQDLFILPCGPRPPNPLELLRAPRILELINSCAGEFDAFVVDSHALGQAADAQMLAHQLGYGLLVARQDQTLIADLREAREALQAAGVDVLGTVYNSYGVGGRTGWPNWMTKWFRRSKG